MDYRWPCGCVSPAEGGDVTQPCAECSDPPGEQAWTVDCWDCCVTYQQMRTPRPEICGACGSARIRVSILTKEARTVLTTYRITRRVPETTVDNRATSELLEEYRAQIEVLKQEIERLKHGGAK